MNDARSRDTAKRCVYETEGYIYTRDGNMPVLLETVMYSALNREYKASSEKRRQIILL